MRAGEAAQKALDRATEKYLKFAERIANEASERAEFGTSEIRWPSTKAVRAKVFYVPVGRRNMIGLLHIGAEALKKGLSLHSGRGVRKFLKYRLFDQPTKITVARYEASKRRAQIGVDEMRALLQKHRIKRHIPKNVVGFEVHHVTGSGYKAHVKYEKDQPMGRGISIPNTIIILTSREQWPPIEYRTSPSPNARGASVMNVFETIGKNRYCAILSEVWRRA